MDLVLTVRSASICMAAMERSANFVAQLQQDHVHTVHTENTNDN